MLSPPDLPFTLNPAELTGPRQRIAVIGGGVSGNVAARLLSGSHEITLFEASDYLGGHANTVEFEAWGKSLAVDTGFMVFNEATYPLFCQLLDELGVASQDCEMSFSVRSERDQLEYCGSSLNGLFAQRGNLVRPTFYRMLSEIVRFNREAAEWLGSEQSECSLGEFLTARRFGKNFVEHYLVPMTAAVWSAPPLGMLDFPARYLFAFLKNHGLIQLRNRPQWKTIIGGSRNYVEPLLQPIRDRIRANCRIQTVRRFADRVIVEPEQGDSESFDQVVFACHSDQVLAMLADATETEQELLSAIPYQTNQAVLHLDESRLPRRYRAWASWNYVVPGNLDSPVTVTYDLQRLQNVAAPAPILLTLNDHDPIDPAQVVRTFSYDHPQFSQRSLAAQQRHGEINGQWRSWFCGAYWGYGFHEDGVRSAVHVVHTMEASLASCRARSTKERYGTIATAR